MVEPEGQVSRYFWIRKISLHLMTTKNDEKWMANFLALKNYIAERGHLPDKHVVENRSLLSWAKYNLRKIKEGTLEPEKVQVFNELMATRSTEHTGGGHANHALA